MQAGPQFPRRNSESFLSFVSYCSGNVATDGCVFEELVVKSAQKATKEQDHFYTRIYPNTASYSKTFKSSHCTERCVLNSFTQS